MIRRYLRIYYMQHDGTLLGDGAVVSNVLMPIMRVPGTHARADKVAVVSQKRRNACASALGMELRRGKPRFLGVALMLCESARSGEGKVAKRFVGSFAALGKGRAIFVGDIMAPTLDQATTLLTAQMLSVVRADKDAKQV